MLPETDAFITLVDEGTDVERILAVLHDYASKQGGQLGAAVASVSLYQPRHEQLSEIFWLFQKYPPAGYRFTSKPGNLAIFGFEPALTH
jgi:hypothetical protein